MTTKVYDFIVQKKIIYIINFFKWTQETYKNQNHFFNFVIMYFIIY